MTQNTDPVLRLARLVFWGGEGEEGFFIEPDGLEGWEDAPPARFEEVERPQGHGSFDSPAFYESRIVTVRGACRASSAARLGSYRNELMGALQGLQRLTVDYQGTQSYADGRRFGDPKFRTLVPGRIAWYQFSFRCPDPRRYGDSRRFVAAGDELVQVSHRGNFPASPILTVSGQAPGYTVNGKGGRRYEVDMAVAPGRPHTIDLATGQLVVGGLARYGVLRQADTWTIAPGDPYDMRLVPTGGSLTMEATVKDTYI